MIPIAKAAMVVSSSNNDKNIEAMITVAIQRALVNPPES